MAQHIAMPVEADHIMYASEKGMMTAQSLLDCATRIIREEFAARQIVVEQIMLFGSRARGDARPDSDWDFLVVTGTPVSWDEKRGIWLRLARRLAAYAITADILIKFEQDFERDRRDVGKTTYYAFREGVRL